MEQFTVLTLMYRDAHNYKTFDAVSFPGAITPQLEATLRANLLVNDQFIPSQVGLPAAAFEDSSYEDDHDYNELSDVEVTAFARGYVDERTIEEFVAQVAAHEWTDPTSGKALVKGR